MKPFRLETQHAHQPRKEINPMPSPFGEGQTVTPINHRHLGEVLTRLPQGGEAMCSSNKTLTWKTVTIIN